MAFRLMALACCALASVATAAAVAADPLSIDVAGVRLRMTPGEARAALVGAGYRLDAPSMVDSFQQAVRREADQRLGRPMVFPKNAGTSAIVAVGPRLERANVSFAQTSAGSVVSEVTIDVPEASITSADFRAQAKAKYGAPGRSRFGDAEMTWCMREVGSNCGASYVATGPEPADFPELATTSYGGGGRIRLTSGRRWFAALDREREAAVEALAPKSRKAAF